MKRKAKSLDAECDSDIDTDTMKHGIEESADNVKRKKVEFEKPLSNKSSGKEVKKTSPIKKDSKKKSLNNTKLNATTEKIDWLKLKKEKKELRETRKAGKLKDDRVYDTVNQAKQIYEKLRRSDCTAQDRTKLVQTLHEKLKTVYNKVIFTHDMSRVIQCMLKYCEADIQQAVCHEIKSSVVEMSQSKYARKCIEIILKCGSQEIKTEIISGFYGNIVKLMSHLTSASLIELIYSSYCEDLDEMYFKQEFYGDMYKQAKDKNVRTLSDVFKTAESMKPATLSAVKRNLIRILDKGLINSTLLHTILWEFFSVCSVEDRNELIVMLRAFIVKLSETKMGARVAAQCIWHGNNKDRKIMMKALKSNVKMICTSEYGYMTLLALFDSIDDTIIVKKIILMELQQDLIDIGLNEYGKHVILYLVARRDPRYFPPSVVEYLCQGDNNSISKKPADVREKELLEAISDSLLEAVTADIAKWLSNSSIAMVTLAILKVGSGKKLNLAFKLIAEFVSNVDSKVKQDDVECGIIEHPGLHMMLKKLIQNDKELLKKNESTFGEILISQLTAEVLKRWIECNRACFLLIALVENEPENILCTLLAELKSIVNSLKLKTSPGASILLKKLKQEST